MTERTLERTTYVPRPLSEVFPFFADPANLQALTPPWLSLRILTPLPVMMRAGRILDYRIALRGVPLAWQSEITEWEPPYRFVDEQRRGPYRRWIHEHLFKERDGGTEVVDRVRYAVRGGRLFGRLVAWLVVDRDLSRIFDFRQQRLAELLSPAPEPVGPRRG